MPSDEEIVAAWKTIARAKRDFAVALAAFDAILTAPCARDEELQRVVSHAAAALMILENDADVAGLGEEFLTTMRGSAERRAGDANRALLMRDATRTAMRLAAHLKDPALTREQRSTLSQHMLTCLEGIAALRADGVEMEFGLTDEAIAAFAKGQN